MTTKIIRFGEGQIYEVIETENPEIYNAPGYMIYGGGSVDPSTHYIVGSGKVTLKPNKPSDRHTFNYLTGQWFIDTDSEWDLVRRMRDRALQRCDWTQMPDVAMSDEVMNAWKAYRQALRDVTLQEDVLNIKWPISP